MSLFLTPSESRILSLHSCAQKIRARLFLLISPLSSPFFPHGFNPKSHKSRAPGDLAPRPYLSFPFWQGFSLTFLLCVRNTSCVYFVAILAVIFLDRSGPRGRNDTMKTGSANMQLNSKAYFSVVLFSLFFCAQKSRFE